MPRTWRSRLIAEILPCGVVSTGGQSAAGRAQARSETGFAPRIGSGRSLYFTASERLSRQIPESSLAEGWETAG